MHACGLTFSDGTLSVGAITINVINNNTSTNPPTTPEVPPSNGGTEVKPPENVKKNPTIKNQVLSYDTADSKDLVVTDVIFDGDTLSYIYIGSNLVDAKDLTFTNDTITIPAQVLSKLTLVIGNYDISFKFSTGASLIGNVDLAFKDSSISPSFAIEEDSSNNNSSEEAEAEQKPVDQQNPIVPSEDKENVKTPSSDNKNEPSVGTSNNASTLPKTGYAVTGSLIGTIVTGIGTILLRRKK